jgi:hypothetical protein
MLAGDRGRPPRSWRCALRRRSQRRSARWSCSSCSTPHCLPSDALTGVLAMTRRGTESEYACAAAVRMLVSPGPEMVNAAAGRPLRRA